MKYLRYSMLLMVWLLLGQGLSAQAIQPIKMKPLLDTASSVRGVLVINFWSTWCKPCVDELPHFMEVGRVMADDGVQLWLVSQDTRSLYTTGQLKAYLQQKQWKAKHFWLDETDADYYCPLVDATWSGAIPATLVLNPRTGYRAFYEESLTKDALVAAIKKAMQ